jgi:hypothetical protein
MTRTRAALIICLLGGVASTGHASEDEEDVPPPADAPPPVVEPASTPPPAVSPPPPIVPAPPGPVPAVVTASTPPQPRPSWAHWFELGLGPSITGRDFSTDPAPPHFKGSVTPGIAVDLTVYPLAFTWNKALGYLSGFGLGLTVVKPFWPDASPVSDTTMHISTSELRIEGGLRYKATLYKPIPRPQLQLLVEGGLHSFTFGGQGIIFGSVDPGIPDVRYVYASIGTGVTMHFAEWSWIWAKVVYHAVTDSGPLQSPAQYGVAAVYGLGVSGGVDFLAWRGIRVGAQGMYERFNATFGFDPANRTKIADSATDAYYGALIVVGYVL